MRAFVAIDFDDAIKRQLAREQQSLRLQFPKLSWVRPEHLHLTLKFLGEIQDRQMEPIARSLDDLCSATPPFEFEVANLGIFPQAGPPRVLWAGIVDATGALLNCHGQCEARFKTLGFPPEGRPFSPHLTLARIKNPAVARDLRAAVVGHRPFSAGLQSVTGLTFFQSELTPAGPIHTPLSRHDFSGG